MIDIRPVSDLRNNFAELEKAVQDGHPIFLTKNGYGTMVLMSVNTFESIQYDNEVYLKLKEAEEASKKTDVRYSSKEIEDMVIKTLRGE